MKTIAIEQPIINFISNRLDNLSIHTTQKAIINAKLLAKHISERIFVAPESVLNATP